jgi:2-haloacid dehalogenase
VADRWVTFDCYGTLIDWNGGIGREFERLFGSAAAARLLHRYHELEPAVQAEDPMRTYREVLDLALARLAATEGLRLPEPESYALSRSLPGWAPFPEVPAALERLRARGWRLAVLSNSDPDLLAASLARIGVAVELTVVASEIGSYKPATNIPRCANGLLGILAGPFTSPYIGILAQRVSIGFGSDPHIGVQKVPLLLGCAERASRERARPS